MRRWSQKLIESVRDHREQRQALERELLLSDDDEDEESQEESRRACSPTTTRIRRLSCLAGQSTPPRRSSALLLQDNANFEDINEHDSDSEDSSWNEPEEEEESTVVDDEMMNEDDSNTSREDIVDSESLKEQEKENGWKAAIEMIDNGPTLLSLMPQDQHNDLQEGEDASSRTGLPVVDNDSDNQQEEDCISSRSVLEPNLISQPCCLAAPKSDAGVIYGTQLSNPKKNESILSVDDSNAIMEDGLQPEAEEKTTTTSRTSTGPIILPMEEVTSEKDEIHHREETAEDANNSAFLPVPDDSDNHRPEDWNSQPCRHSAAHDSNESIQGIVTDADGDGDSGAIAQEGPQTQPEIASSVSSLSEEEERQAERMTTARRMGLIIISSKEATSSAGVNNALPYFNVSSDDDDDEEEQPHLIFIPSSTTQDSQTDLDKDRCPTLMTSMPSQEEEEEDQKRRRAEAFSLLFPQAYRDETMLSCESSKSDQRNRMMMLMSSRHHNSRVQWHAYAILAAAIILTLGMIARAGVSLGYGYTSIENCTCSTNSLPSSGSEKVREPIARLESNSLPQPNNNQVCTATTTQPSLTMLPIAATKPAMPHQKTNQMAVLSLIAAPPPRQHLRPSTLDVTTFPLTDLNQTSTVPAALRNSSIVAAPRQQNPVFHPVNSITGILPFPTSRQLTVIGVSTALTTAGVVLAATTPKILASLAATGVLSGTMMPATGSLVVGLGALSIGLHILQGIRLILRRFVVPRLNKGKIR